VVLENGTVRKIGSFEEIEPELPQDHHSSDSDDSLNQEVTETTKQANLSTLKNVLSNIDGESIELENARRDGKWSVYSYYFKSAGWTLMISLVAAIFICGFTDRFSSS
jgi:hypothetical protein